MPKILIIAYHFYPDLEVGAVRSIKFARYLPEFGWAPYILTIDTRFIPKTDQSELAPNCPIFRTSKWPTLDDLIASFRRRLGYRNNSAADTMNSPGSPETSSSAAGERKQPLWKRLINSISVTPDEKIGWFFPAAARAISLIRKYDIDIIYSSGPPYTCHLVGLIAKIITRRKWVADFRDPWTTAVRLGGHFNAISNTVENYMENAVISRADHILTTTPAITAQLMVHHPQKMEGKCSTILNGYDEEDFRGKSRRREKGAKPVTFLYAGTLYLGRDPSLIFRSTAELLNEGCLKKEEIKLEFVGNNEQGEAQIKRVIADLGISDIVSFGDTVSKDHYFDLIINADVLILLQSKMAVPQIPGKTYEYLATGNKILALVPEGATRDVLQGLSGVFISDPDDKNRIKECILALVKGANSNWDDLGKNEAFLREITRRSQTDLLSKLMNKMI